jgi:hypothetical protein
MEAVNFYRKIETHWAELWVSMRQTLFSEVDDFANGTTPDTIFESSHSVVLEFWSLEPGKVSWEISCTTLLDNHVFGIEMLG